jgi:energy-coupling factor transport system permease protein
MVALAGWGSGRLPLSALWQSARTLRWLFLFTLIVHVLFTPGHTLFGRTWLSADGLLIGTMACWRILLALIFAVLLSASTAPPSVAGALGRLFGPLERWRVPVRQSVEMILMVLHFIPLFREEALVVHAELLEERAGAPPVGILQRGRFAGAMIRPLLLRLVQRADDLARRLAAGEALEDLEAAAPTESLSALQVAAFAGAAGILFLLYRSLA